MNVQEFAKMLDGREYDYEITTSEDIDAMQLGFVIIFGYSDDNAELRGAIQDEIGCYGGGIIYFDENGLCT
jgi:hypothetical protein